MTRYLTKSLMAIACLVAAGSLNAHDCFEKHARTFGLNADILRSIAIVESSGNSKAVGKNSGSEDLGLMQINSSWIKKKGTSRAELLDNPCLNLQLGAEILSDNLKRFENQWEAVGAYNAACTRLKGDDCKRARQSYAWKVFKAFKSLNDSKRSQLAEVVKHTDA